MKSVNFSRIYTPQGALGNIMRNPNLDLMMNLFRIPRAYAVSGFGDWNVGKHSLCTAFIALRWARLTRMREEKKNEFVVLALLHDLHEAVTGDILPFFKTTDARKAIEQIQSSFLESFGVKVPPVLVVDLKIADMVAFLYEIKQSSAATMRREQARWLRRIYARQKQELMKYAKSFKVRTSLIHLFLKELSL